MTPFIAFVKKEFKHIFRDKRSLFILLGMPIILVILFGFAIKNEINDAKIAIIQHGNDPLVEQLKNKIVSSSFFTLQGVYHNEQILPSLFKKGEIKLAIIFQEGFGRSYYGEDKSSLQIITDASEPNTAVTLINYLEQIIRKFQLQQNSFSSIPYRIHVENRMLYNPSLKSVMYFVPGVMTIILMLISAMMTSITIAREKEKGTMEILLVSPLSPFIIIIGKVVPYILLSLFNAATIILLGVYVFGMPIEGSIFLLIVELLIFVITSLSLGIFISTKSQSQQVAMLASMMGLMLPSVLLSGFIFPLDSMPVILQNIANIIPAKWFVIIIRGIMVKGVGINYLWQETGVLLLMSIILIGLSIKGFKIRLEK